MPVLYNNQTIKLPFDISKLDNLYQPYRYAEYNVWDDTLVGTHLYIAYSKCRPLPVTYYACFIQ